MYYLCDLILKENVLFQFQDLSSPKKNNQFKKTIPNVNSDFTATYTTSDCYLYC